MVLSNNVIYQINTNSVVEEKIFALESSSSFSPFISGHMNENLTFMLFTSNKKCVLIDTTRAEITLI